MATKKKSDGMIVQVASDELLRALTRVGAVVEKQTDTPALSCALLSTEKTGDGGKLSVSAYDMEIGLTSRHPAEVTRKGTIAVPAKLLRAIVGLAPENVISLEALDNNRVLVSSGNMESEIAGLNPEEVQTVSVPESMRFSPCDTAALLSLIDGVLLAVCHDDSRANLCGALLERTKTGWRMIATNGHRLSVLERVIEDSNAKAVDGKVFLTDKTLLVLKNILKEEDAAVGSLGFNKTVLAFQREGLDIVSRLATESFPNWREVLPETSGHTVQVSRTALIRAAERMGPIGGRAGMTVLHVGKNVIKLRAQNPDRGTTTDRLIIEHEGADVTLGLNTGYLLDALQSLDAEHVELGVEDSLSPVVVRPIGNERNSAWVVMPMRVEVAEIEKLATEDLETVFPSVRAEFKEQTRKKIALEAVRKLARDAAQTARKEAGKPLVRVDGQAWPTKGFWEKAEIDLGREIPDDERAICRDTYWAEATKPSREDQEEAVIPDSEMKVRLSEMEVIGRMHGNKAKAANGNKLVAWRLWPASGFWLQLEHELQRNLTAAEKEICQAEYHGVATGGPKPA